MKAFVVPGWYGQRRIGDVCFFGYSYTVQVSSWESPIVALTGLGLVRTAITPVVLFPYDCRRLLALVQRFLATPGREDKSHLAVKLVERARG